MTKRRLRTLIRVCEDGRREECDTELTRNIWLAAEKKRVEKGGR